MSLLCSSLPGHAFTPLILPDLDGSGINTTKIFDGSVVHNVGELQMNITNWGMFGSFPGLALEMSDAASAQWPAGSGIEHMFFGEVWIGAKVSGIPRVSTAVVNSEFASYRNPINTVYRSFEGDDRGRRYPSGLADDDEDGLVDEDPLNGRDDDGDGAIDEDFAAVGSQVFRCSYRDDLPEILRDEPDHNPLGVEIIQQSHQWDNAQADDFIGVEFTIFNRSNNDLEDLFYGFYMDPDVGSRSTAGNYNDDVVGYTEQGACYQRQAGQKYVTVRLASAWDGDGDVDSSVPASSHFGVMLLDHSISSAGMLAIEHLNEGYLFKAPGEVSVRAWQVFSSIKPYVEGGEPTNDAQRYDALSREGIDPTPVLPGDYRMLVSAGPFYLEPGDSVTVQIAFVAGPDAEGLLENAIEAANAYEGTYFNKDNKYWTGWYCAEHHLYDHYKEMQWVFPCVDLAVPIIIPKRTNIWVNDDCREEGLARVNCTRLVEPCTGIGGREAQLTWLTEAPPPPPNLRIWATENKNVLFWDSFSESVPDMMSDLYDFEGYRVWRADNWNRPSGTTIANGPSSSNWMLLAEYDAINGLLPDAGFSGIRYQPNIDANLVTYYTEKLLQDQRIMTAADHLPPIGYTRAVADTAICLARKTLGLPGGKSYYRYEDIYVRSGLPYFYNVTAMDHKLEQGVGGVLLRFRQGLSGDPSNGFLYAVPQTASQETWEFDRSRVYVVPNPATPESMAPWALGPNMSDPTGLKVEFRHLPAAPCTIRIFTLAGDHIRTLHHDPTEAIAAGDLESSGSMAWDLVSRNKQDVCSGVYLFVVEASGFPKTTGRFTVIR
ncbi:MAG: hypothetical protein GY835_08570 [bacterium]|nr:hypothetical protein [bacterium]